MMQLEYQTASHLKIPHNQMELDEQPQTTK
jgi:hypothetical protein